MWKPFRLKTLGVVLFLVLAVGLTATFAAGSKPLAAQQEPATATPQPTPRMPGKMLGKMGGTGDDWIIFNLPKDAPQIAYGEEIYRLVCSACHGDIGQGLTPEWRSTWAPEDQNCWQSKCHGPNHPPEGFTFPVAPAINNLTLQAKFPTALQLQAYIHAAMPWYKPGALTDERAWQVTAYVLKLNKIDAGTVLTAGNAASIRVAPEISPTSIEAAVASSRTGTAPTSEGLLASNNMTLLIPALIVMFFLLVGGILLRRKARH